MKVWLDDVRPAPEGSVRVRTPEEAIDLLRGCGVDELTTIPAMSVHSGDVGAAWRMEQAVESVRRLAGAADPS